MDDIAHNLKEIMITLAEEKDIPQLVRLINAAYRGNESRQGWTHEADLIDGDLRTDEQVISTLLEREGSVILKYIDGDEIAGCVHLENQNARLAGSPDYYRYGQGKLYLGMLSVFPTKQGKNIGKKLLAAAEEHAAKNKVNFIVMNVISVRHELIHWYEKQGYKKTGEMKPFPAGDKFGSPKQPLEFVVLEKKIG
jgi:ribosomal protein S18 acetylase RimI-like enzyme